MTPEHGSVITRTLRGVFVLGHLMISSSFFGFLFLRFPYFRRLFLEKMRWSMAASLLRLLSRSMIDSLLACGTEFDNEIGCIVSETNLKSCLFGNSVINNTGCGINPPNIPVVSTLKRDKLRRGASESSYV